MQVGIYVYNALYHNISIQFLIPAQIFVLEVIMQTILIIYVINVIIPAHYVAILLVVICVTKTLIEYCKAIGVNAKTVIMMTVHNYV